MEKAQKHLSDYRRRGVRSFDDPLAVEIGLGVGVQDIPAEGWPRTFDPEIAKKILSFLPEEDF